ncbi:MAG: asparagine synthetase B family protein, partial [Candidatus Zixiibacteriota bacterium]
VRLQDEPIADPVCVPVYFVSKLARDSGVIVCQVGEGADELFCGYPGWKTLLKLQGLNDLPVPGRLKKLGLAALRAVGRSEKFYYEWLRRASDGQPVFWGGAEAFSEAQKNRLLSPRLRRRFRHRTSWDAIEGVHARYHDRARSPSHLGWMSYLDLNFRLPELLLMRVDKMSMGASLEARVPFLDHKLVELAMGVPDALKLKNGTLKYILKESVRGLLPTTIVDRRKQGFGVPVYEWFFDKLGARAHEEIERFCRDTDVLDPQAVRRLETEGRSQQLWYLMNLAMWWRQYVAV